MDLGPGLPTPAPTSPTLRKKGKGKAVEGDGDVEMLDGDEDLRGRSTLLKCTFFSLYSFISAILLQEYRTDCLYSFSYSEATTTFESFCHLPSTHVVSRSGAPRPQIAPPTRPTRWPRRWRICKKWMHRELETLSMGGTREASLSPWSWSRSSSGGKQELDGIFRGTAGGAGRMGLGIRIEDD